MENRETQSIDKISDIKPVSFDSKFSNMTNGQIELLKLLSDNLKAGQPISRNDILELYIRALHPTGIKLQTWGTFWNGKWTNSREVDLRKYGMQEALSWFKQNLGSCILKGKLLAIPIIEI